MARSQGCLAWATNSYTEDLIKIFAGDGEADRAHEGKVTFKGAATFLRNFISAPLDVREAGA